MSPLPLILGWATRALPRTHRQKKSVPPPLLGQYLRTHPKNVPFLNGRSNGIKRVWRGQASMSKKAEVSFSLITGLAWVNSDF